MDQRYILMGDFNFPKDVVEWENGDLGVVAHPVGGSSVLKRCFSHLSNVTDGHDLHQVVTVPTRGENILDLMFTNVPEVFSRCTATNIAPLSDHNLLHCTCSAPPVCRVSGGTTVQPVLAAQINFGPPTLVGAGPIRSSS